MKTVGLIFRVYPPTQDKSVWISLDNVGRAKA